MSNDNQKDPLSYWQSRALEAERERDELAAHVERLREALCPFSEAADYVPDYVSAIRLQYEMLGAEVDELAAFDGEDIADARAAFASAPARSLREVRHQERERERERAALICDEEADEWDSDRLVTHKNYAAYCARRIRSPDQ